MSLSFRSDDQEIIDEYTIAISALRDLIFSRVREKGGTYTEARYRLESSPAYRALLNGYNISRLSITPVFVPEGEMRRIIP